MRIHDAKDRIAFFLLQHTKAKLYRFSEFTFGLRLEPMRQAQGTFFLLATLFTNLPESLRCNLVVLRLCFTGMINATLFEETSATIEIMKCSVR